MITYRQPFVGDYPVTQAYGVVIPGVTFKDRPHSGIDYGCPAGTPILASRGGTVVYSDFDPSGYGHLVKILHPDNNMTLYAHLSERHVGKGAAVRQGDVIGLSGNTGNSNGPHLHFEARKYPHRWQDHIDPMTLPMMSVDDSVVIAENAATTTLEPTVMQNLTGDAPGSVIMQNPAAADLGPTDMQNPTGAAVQGLTVIQKVAASGPRPMVVQKLKEPSELGDLVEVVCPYGAKAFNPDWSIKYYGFPQGTKLCFTGKTVKRPEFPDYTYCEVYEEPRKYYVAVHDNQTQILDDAGICTNYG